MDLSPAAQVTASSSPTPGDAVGAFSVGAIDATTLLPESYSSEGPTDDGRNKPDITAPTNVLITPGDPEAEALTSCGGTSCATPHVGGAAALLWPGVAADGGAGSVAQRVRDRLVAQALDMGTPGTDTVFGAGRLRLDLAAPVLGRAVARQQRARARNGRARAAGRGCGHARAAAAHGRRQAARGHARARRHPARQLADRRASRRVRTPSTSWPPTRAATARPTTSRCASTTRRRACACARRSARASASRCASSASVLDSGSGLAGRPRITFGDGTHANGFHLAHRYKRKGRYTITIRATDRAGNSTLVRRTRARARRPSRRLAGGRLAA